MEPGTRTRSPSCRHIKRKSSCLISNAQRVPPGIVRDAAGVPRYDVFSNS